MRGNVIDGVFTDKLRAQDLCAGIVRGVLEDQLAFARGAGFRNYAIGMQAIGWPEIKVAIGSLDD
jgi:hypothetical protein